jgi:RNA recognition motif-containing protein
MEFEQNSAVDYLDSKIGRFNKDSSVFTIYVANLGFDLLETDIRDMFDSFGYVSYVKIVKDSSTHLSKGLAFVQMPSQTHAKLAISALNNSEQDGRVLKVSIAQENDKDRVKITKIRRKPYKAYISKKER